MSHSSEEFARYAKAERQLCDEAAPMLATIVRAIEGQTGLRITELRVTVDRAKSSDGSITANCTIVHAHNAANSDGHGALLAADPAGRPGDGLSPSQD